MFLHSNPLCLLLAIASVSGAFAFSPPVATQDGVTLSIEGFEDLSDESRSAVSKARSDAPLPITVLITNNRTNAVSGTLSVWLNDDWAVTDATDIATRLEPGQTQHHVITAKAKASVLNALYPVHAELTLPDPATSLHAIALFEAVTPTPPTPPTRHSHALIGDGVFRLDADADWQVAYRQANEVVDLGTGFSGHDERSGTVMSRSEMTRGGISRSGFIVHPPYRGGPGVAWTDFEIALPDRKPIRLSFNTAIRDNAPSEPPSDGTEHKVFVIDGDGVEHEVFSRFSSSKTWLNATVDLGAYAGRSITLRLWTGPGPANDTTCDQGYWGDPVIAVGETPAVQTEDEWQSLDAAAVARARKAVYADSAFGPGEFQLISKGIVLGAGIALGRQGLTDGVIAFSDGQRDLVYRGFACEIDDAPVGGSENGRPIQKVGTSSELGVWIVTHRIPSTSAMQPLTVRAKIWADGGALRIAWDIPDAEINARGNPRYTKLGIGPAQIPVWRAYAGFGNVIENPGPFELHANGFLLSTRHVGADYTNGMSLVQATDIFPDRLVHSPAVRRFALEAHHDASFFFIPSTNGAFAAAREYSHRCGFQRGPGVEKLLGRICLDQWGGDYLAAAEDIQEAARYGVTHAVFVKHAWQRWGYDYRLPEIYPPADGLAPFLAMRNAARDAGMMFCPHDNYIDFYPDAKGFSYDAIVFNKKGEPVRAWYNKGCGAQSYRWLPHAFMPWMEDNMRQMCAGFAPDSLFIDVFTAIAPFDFYDRAGLFHPSPDTVKGWRNAFDTCRNILGGDAPMISEAGTDALIGSLDAGQADHFPARRWLKEFGDAERTPWHDMATHGKMILFAGGLGSRYSASDWDKDNMPEHGYGSDDYLSNTVIGGRNPMCDGPFSRRAVMTYWLLHDVCNELARMPFETHEFGATIKQQHTTFGDGGSVWVNRGTNIVWRVVDGRLLPEYGFYAKTPDAEAGIVLLNGQRAAYARSEKTFFADARPMHNSAGRVKAESSTAAGRYLGDGVFDVTFNWKVLLPSFVGYVPFLHLCNDDIKGREHEHIAFHGSMDFDLALLRRPGKFTATSRITVPRDMPAGDYHIRYGLYHPTTGNRLRISGLADENNRIRGGVLHVEKQGDRFTVGVFVPETESTDAKQLGQNIENKMLDFGPLVTDGAFRLLHEGDREWQLIPLPGSRPFRAEIRLDQFGKKHPCIKAMENVEAFHAASKSPDWTQEGDLLRLSCDAQAFAYRIVFE